MQTSQRQINALGANLQKVGKNLSVSLTAPIVGLGGVAVKAAADMETLKTSLDTVFQGNQDLSTQAFDDIKDFAATTPFQLDEVASAFIKLKNLGLDPSQEALTSYGNTASALGKSLDQMIEAVADASVGEFERLKEFGIKAKSQGDDVAFTFQGVTTTVGKNSEEISAYLQNIGNVNFAGSIERQAATFNGRLSTLKDNLTQAFAGIGVIIIEYITPLFDKLNGLLQSFQELSPTTKKWIVILGGVAAVIGPLLALAGTILPAIGTGFALLTGPIGLVVAALVAVGVAVYKNWEPIKQTLVDVANYFVDLYNESTVFRVGVEAVIATFKNLFEIGKFAFEGLKSLLSGFVNNFVTGFTSIGKIFKAVLTGNFKALPGIVADASAETKSNFSGLTTNLGNDWDNLLTGIKANTNNALENITTRKKLAYLKENVDATAIKEAVKEATVQGINEGAGAGVGTGVSSSSDVPEAFDLAGLDALIADTGGKIDEAIANATGESFLSSMQEAMDNDIVKMDTRLDEFVTKLKEQSARMVEIGQVVGEEVGSAFEGLTGRMVDSFGLAETGFDGFIKGMVTTVTKLIAMMLSQSIATSIAGATASGTATGPGAVFATPGFIATAVSGVLGAFAAIPKFETGGIVGGSSYYGDKLLARVNSGEAIFNQAQQKRLYSLTQTTGVATTIIPDIRIQGRDLKLVFDREENYQARIS